MDIVVDKKNFKTKLLGKKLSKMVFKKELEKIEGKLQTSEADKNVLRGNQRFTKNETEMIFQHFKRFLDTETIPRKQDIIPFIEENNFQAEEVDWHDIKSKIKTKQQNMKKKNANRDNKLKRKLLQKQSQGNLSLYFNLYSCPLFVGLRFIRQGPRNRFHG